MAIDYVDVWSSSFFITPLACGILSMWDMADSGVNGIIFIFSWETLRLVEVHAKSIV